MLNAVLITVGFLVFLGVAFVVAAKAGLLTESSSTAGDDETPADARYRQRPDAVLTEHERAFAPTLEKAARQLLDDLGPLRVLAKVNLADLIEPDCPRGSPKSPEGRQWRSWWQSINRSHTDFVLVDDQWRPVCVVELDDASHRRAKAKVADAKKDAALAGAGVPLVRVTSRDGVDAVAGSIRDATRS
ncbi:MAG: DUF2726 domain-containing protein [Planctomycetota bacterium]